MSVTIGDPIIGEAVSTGPPLTFNPTAGSGGGGIAAYQHIQTTPAAVWTVTHNLGRRPAAVTVFSLDYSTQWDLFAVQHRDINTLLIAPDIPISGIALIE